MENICSTFFEARPDVLELLHTFVDVCLRNDAVVDATEEPESVDIYIVSCLVMIASGLSLLVLAVVRCH